MWHRDSMILSFIVGMAICVHVPPDYGALAWYMICIFLETVVLMSAILLRSTISPAISGLSVMFIVVHCLGYFFDGYQPTSPYHYTAQTLEILELVSCVLFSPTTVEFIKKVVKHEY